MSKLYRDLSMQIDQTQFDSFEDLLEYYQNYYKLDEDDLDEIMYLEHDDAHASDNVVDVVRKLTKSKQYGPICKRPLYRGCSRAELNDYLQNGLSQKIRLSSFSEDINVAKQFGSELITLLPSNRKIFCYHKFLTDYYNFIKSFDEDYYEENDCEWLTNEANKEAEWIVSLHPKFAVYKLEVVDEAKRIFQLVVRY